jgi:hypothetical protein
VCRKVCGFESRLRHVKRPSYISWVFLLIAAIGI